MNILQLSVIIAIHLIFVLVKQTDGELTQLPDDAQVAVGSTVKLTCFVKRVDYPPAWSHFRVGEREHNDIYITLRDRIQGNKIVGKMTEPYYQRFRVDEDGVKGEYSLIISQVQTQDAGKYACTARGGLGQKAFAELIVIELPLNCQSNINSTYILGENDCHQGTDQVNMSCSFRSYGNAMPKVSWTKSNEPETRAPGSEDTAQRTQQADEVVSKFVTDAASEGVNGSSFIFTVHSTVNVTPNFNSHQFPTIKVFNVKNITESRTITAPDEIICSPPPGFPMKGCKWIRKKVGSENGNVVVASGEMLNLYKYSSEYGTYVCIVECDVNGRPCPVEALIITFQPSEKVTEEPANSTVLPVAVTVSAVGLILTTILILLGYFVIKKWRPRDSTSKLTVSVSTTNGSRSSKELEPLNRTEQVNRNTDASIDIPDSKVGKPGERELRLRLIEEKAKARMEANALRQRNEMPRNVADSVDGDVAEGLQHSPSTGARDTDKDK